MCLVDYARLDSYGRVLGYAAETIALGDLGRVADARERAAAGYRELVEDAVAIAEQWHGRYADLPGLSRSMAIAAVGMTALGSGDLTAARRHFDSARDSFGDYGDVAGLFYRFRILHTEVLARSGRLDSAVTALAATCENRHPAYEYVESGYLLACAWVAAADGRVTEARELSCQAAEFARNHGQLAREVLALQTVVQFGDASGADRHGELATVVEGPRAPLCARYARALADDNATGLDAVSRDFEAMGDALAAADASAQASSSHRRAGGAAVR